MFGECRQLAYYSLPPRRFENQTLDDVFYLSIDDIAANSLSICRAAEVSMLVLLFPIVCVAYHRSLRPEGIAAVNTATYAFKQICSEAGREGGTAILSSL